MAASTSTTDSDVAELDRINELQLEERSLLILYATETGNSQDCADRIARECRRIAFQCRVVSVDEYDLVSAAMLSDASRN